MGIDFSKIGGQPVEDTPQLAAPAQSPAPAQPAGIDFSHLGAEPVAASSDQDQQGNEGGIGDTLKMFGREVTGPDTLLGAAGRDIAHGVEGIAHGDVSGALWGNAAPHIQQGSTIEKLIQKFDPKFRGAGTPATAAASEQGSLLNKPIVNVSQEIDVKKNPIAKAIAEASQSFTTPENVAILVGTGGLGMVGSAKTLGIANDLLTSGFGAQTIADAYKHLKAFKDAYDDGDEAQAKYELTHAVLSGALGTVIGRHAAGLETPVVGEGDKALAGKAIGAVTDTVGGAKDAAVSAVKKSLGIPEDFLDAVYKISPPSKGYAQEYINKLKVADPQLRQVMRDKPDVGTPEDIFKAIDNHIKQNDSFVASKAAEVEGKPEAAMTGLQNQVRDDLVQAFKDNPGQYKPEEQDKAIAAVLNHVGQETGKSTAEVKDYRDPTLQEAEGVRKRFNQDTQASFGSNAPAVPAAEAFAKKVAANSLRREIDSKFDSLGIKDVKEFRQQEAALIDVRDQLADAVKKSKDMGTYSKLQSFIKQFGWRIPVAAMAGMFGGGVEGGLAAGLGGAGLGMAADYFRDLRSNPNRMTETASRMANEEAAPNAPQPNEVPPKTGGTPSPVIPGTNFTPPSQLPLVKTETPPNGPANPTKATAGPVLGSKIDLPAYNLPTEPAQNVPADRRAEGTLPADVHKHEWGHVTNAAIENFGTEGIKSDTHPDVGPRTAAAATITFHGVDFDNPESVARNSGRILSTILGGAAADELHNGIPFEINRMAGGDVKLLKDVFKKVGFTDDEIDSAIRYGLDRAKRNLTQPGIGDILQSNAKVREADLHPDYHASPERTESYAEEVRRIRDANRTGTEQRNETVVQGNNEADAGKFADKHPEVDAGTEGKVPGKDTERNLPATAVIAPEEEESKEPVTARDALENIKSKYGESSNAAKTGEGASFITPEGKFVHLGTDDHPQVIKKAGYESDSQDTRVPFINESGAIRSNFTTGRAGRTLSFSVPKDGVNEEQIDAMKAAVHQGLGRNGQLRIETADSPTNLKNSIKDFATANNVEPMLREIGVHPEQLKQPKKPNSYAEKEYKESPGWAEKAVQMAKDQDGAFSIDTKSGEAPKTGYMVEARPESRVYLNHEATPEDLQKFHDDNQEYLAEHPDLHVGGWYDSDKGKNELNISARTEDKNQAIRLAKKLDQVAIYDLNKDEPIETNGKSEQTEFPDYPLNQRMADLRGESKPYDEKTSQRISSRFPTAVSATEDPMGHNLTLDVDKILERPKVAQALSEKILNQNKSMVFTPEEKSDPKKLFDSFIKQAKDNIKYVYNQAKTSGNHIVDRVWYDGAHNFGVRDAEASGLEPRQNFAAVATQSPQKDWNQNVSLYERLMDTVLNKPDVKFTPEMNTKANQFIREIAKTNNKRAAQGKSQIDPWVDRKLINKLKGKSLDDLSSPVEKAAWVRLYDEAHNPREFHEIAPDGTKKGIVTLKGTNTPEKVAWGGLDSIAKGISVLQDGSLENISRNLGEAHKVRSFYNNIAEPNSPHEDVTADTHHVGLSLMRPVAGSDPEPALNFGGNGSTITGTHGTYPLYVEATRQAMRELNAEHPDDPPMQYPRQLQSVAWVEWRKMFPPESRTEATKNSVNSIWKEHLDGKITADEARQQVSEFAHRLRSGLDEGEQRPADEGKLPAHQLHGAGDSAGGGAGSSTGTEVSPRAVEINPKKQAAAAGWLSMMQSNKTGQKALGTK